MQRLLYSELLLRCHLLAHVANAQAFQLAAHAKQYFYLFLRDVANEGASPRRDDDQSITLQTQHGLAKRSSAASQLSGYVVLDQSFARLQAPLVDGGSNEILYSLAGRNRADFSGRRLHVVNNNVLIIRGSWRMISDGL